MIALDTERVIDEVGQWVDVVGVAAIVGGLLVATAMTALELRRSRDASVGGRIDGDATFRRYRRRVGRAILLGLEVLVAADIIRSVAVEPTFESVGVLAVIVLIRTFLSVSLEVEIEHRWPWQRRA